MLLKGILLCFSILAPILLKKFKKKEKACDVDFVLLAEVECDKPTVRIVGYD